MNPTIPDLLSALRRAEPAAVQTFVARFRPVGMRLAEALLRDRALAEDAVQEAFVIALERIEQVRSAAALGAWYRQIVRSRCHRVLRRIRPVPTAPEALPATTAEGPDAEQAIGRARAAAAVRAAVAALPAIGRRETELYYFEDRSQAEIAALLGVPTGTVKRRLHTARRRLRAMLVGGLPVDGYGDGPS